MEPSPEPPSLVRGAGMGGSLGGVLGQEYHLENTSRDLSWPDDIGPLAGGLGVC